MKNYPHNPILQNDAFVPDVEAHVFNDGRIYLYGSYDICGKLSYCSNEYHVFSSSDLVNWKDHGVSFSSYDISWLDEDEKGCPLYAPDCAYKNGVYYLYYCIPDGRCGVASSKFPEGPFCDIGQIKGVQGIDPAVLVDGDDAYLYWGQLTWGKAAKLKDNMIEIDISTITQPLTLEEHEFHEGSSVKKINGKYYFLFTDTHRHKCEEHKEGMATSLGYAVSDFPTSGFKYKGIVIDNFGCDPKTWNNHGSIECFNGQWYVFYHRSTHNSENSRRVAIEKIYFDNDGNIKEAKMTSSGVSDAILATENIYAQYACELYGGTFIKKEDDDLILTNMSDGCYAIYRYIEFKNEDEISIVLKSDGDCTLKVYSDEVLISNIKINACEDYKEHLCNVSMTQGIHTLKLEIGGKDTHVSIKEFKFKNKKEIS